MENEKKPEDLQLSTLFTVVHSGYNARIYLNECGTFGMISNPAEQLAIVDAVAGLLGSVREGVLKKMQNAKV